MPDVSQVIALPDALSAYQISALSWKQAYVCTTTLVYCYTNLKSTSLIGEFKYNLSRLKIEPIIINNIVLRCLCCSKH